MKTLIALLTLVSSVAFADVTQLNTWTYDADSVQGVLNDAFQSVVGGELMSPLLNGVVQRENHALVLADGNSKLACESTTVGMAEVMSYRCSLTGDMSVWTNDSDSVQAKLYKVLRAARELDLQSPYARKVIRQRGNTLSVKDGNTTLSCSAKTLGMAMVVSYRCTVR